jgi:hypothetical protein
MYPSADTIMGFSSICIVFMARRQLGRFQTRSLRRIVEGQGSVYLKAILGAIFRQNWKEALRVIVDFAKIPHSKGSVHPAIEAMAFYMTKQYELNCGVR